MKRCAVEENEVARRLASAKGLDEKLVKQRIRKGLSLEDALEPEKKPEMKRRQVWFIRTGSSGGYFGWVEER